MLRNTLFSVWVIGSLLFSTVGLGIFAISQAVRVALFQQILQAPLPNWPQQKQLIRQLFPKQKAKIKAEARLRRGLIAVPVLGANLLVYFEEQDFQEWINENPNAAEVIPL